MILTSKKAFISLITIFFISLFLFIILSDKPNEINDFTVIKIIDTKKQNEILNINKIIENELRKKNNKPYEVKMNINKKLNNYFKENKKTQYYIYNEITNKKTKTSLEELQKISKVIIYQPSKEILYKKYIITNGIEKNKLLNFEINNKNYKTNFYFPKNYGANVIVQDYT